MRKTLEACDLDADIELFVQQKSTGGERPGEAALSGELQGFELAPDICSTRMSLLWRITQTNCFIGPIEREGNIVARDIVDTGTKTCYSGHERLLSAVKGFR